MKTKRVLKKKFQVFLSIYFIFFTSYFTVITLSKYLNKITGQGTTSIAKWEVSSDINDNEIDTLDMIIGNTTQDFTLKVTSTSEIKAVYSVVLTDLPNDLEVKIDGGTYKKPTNHTSTFSNIGYINANAETKTMTHTLTFNAPIDSKTMSASEININVIFNQVDPTEN